MNATHSKETPVGGCLERLVRCPRCGQPATKLWMAEHVLPGDNHDNSTKGWTFACDGCNHIFFTPNVERSHGAENH